MARGSHDTLVRRLAMMLVKLNQGESIEPAALADEFGVNLRTVQRDLNQRLGYLPIERVDGRYRMNPAFLGRLTLKDVERFAALSGVSRLFPALSTDFLRELFDARHEGSLLVKGHHYEDLRDMQAEFIQLQAAIRDRRCVQFAYAKGAAAKTLRVQPHKLLNAKGIWYLVAKHDDAERTYAFSKMSSIRILAERFEPDTSFLKRIEDEDGVWISDRPIDVRFSVDREAAPYFKRRALVPRQSIEDEGIDGSLIVSCQVGHEDQILSIIRYWIPHVRILSPASLQATLERGLVAYVGDGGKAAGA